MYDLENFLVSDFKQRELLSHIDVILGEITILRISSTLEKIKEQVLRSRVHVQISSIYAIKSG